jgi:hypothetical protein
MTSVSGAMPNSTNISGINSQLSTAGNGSAKAFADMSPVEQGDFLRQQGTAGQDGGTAGTNMLSRGLGRFTSGDGMERSGSRVPDAGLGAPKASTSKTQSIDCDKIPGDLRVRVVTGSGAKVVGGGGAAAVGFFNGTERQGNGNSYSGRVTSQSALWGLGGGVSANVDYTHLKDLAGMSKSSSISTPVGGINITSNLNNEITGLGMNSPGKIGITDGISNTQITDCKVHVR